MTTSAAPAPEASQSLENVNTILSRDHVSHSALARALDSSRAACATALLNDIGAASAEKVEDRLWSVHLKANTHFRNELRKLKEGGNARAVERRKLSTDYLKFIKSSQKFFRTYIRSLDKAYGGIHELHTLAGKLGSGDDLSTAAASNVATVAAVRGEVLGSAYRSLIQLGDLSRYRESELSEQTPNWSFAVGYYDLARFVIPSSGVAFNQLAIVALADGNLFQATYYLFRSLAVKERHPQAEANLRKAFFKISSAWEKGELVESASALVAWHLRLVSKCYHGKQFAEHNELEKEVASRLKAELKCITLESTLRKFLLINFAACHFAQERFTAAPNAEENFSSYTNFLRLNLTCTCTVLSCLKEQMGATQTDNSAKGVANLRKLFILVRLSTLWIAKNARVLANSVSSDVDGLQSELWRVLTDCLVVAFSNFGVEKLPECGYLLEEDEDTIAFEPLLCDQTRGVWFDRDGQLRFSRESLAQPKGEPEKEFFSRVRLFLKIGMQFAVDERLPIVYDMDLASFKCTISIAPVYAGEAPQENPVAATCPEPAIETTPADEDDKEAEEMVSSLVGAAPLEPDDSPSANAEQLLPTPAFPTGRHTASDLVQAMQNFSQRPFSRGRTEAPPLQPLRTSPPNPVSRSAGVQQVPATLPSMQSALPRSRPGSGSNAEASFNAAPPLTPEQALRQNGVNAIVQPSSSSMNGLHSRGQSIDSNHSHHSLWNPNAGWSSGQAPPLPISAGKASLSSSFSLGNGTFNRQEWPGVSSQGFGAGSSLAFGAPTSPWSKTPVEDRRMSASSPRLGAIPGLRRDSGNSPGTIGSNRRMSKPAG